MNKSVTRNKLEKLRIILKHIKVFLTILLVFVGCLSFSQASILYDFNTASQLAGVFNSSEAGVANVTEFTTGGIGGSGDPYHIGFLENLYSSEALDTDVASPNRAASWTSTANDIQAANINASAASTWFAGEGRSPIENATSKFLGTETAGLIEFSEDSGTTTAEMMSAATFTTDLIADAWDLRNSTGDRMINPMGYRSYSYLQDISYDAPIAIPLVNLIPAFTSTLWYVNDSATGANDGTTWTDAFTTIQAAVDAASAGDIILVAGGTYISTSAEVVLINPSKNFSGVKMYGGYEGTEVLTSADLKLDERDLVTNASIIDGQTTRRGISISGFVGGHSLSEETLLDGFTIQNGRSSNGAGLFIGANGSTNISPVIRNTRFLNNQTTGTGGSVYLGIFSVTTTQLIFDKVLFKNNAGSIGGAMYSIGDHGDLNYTVINSIFDGNSAGVGGAIGYDDAQTGFPSFINSTFYNNTVTTSGNGGVIHITHHDSPSAPATFKSAVFRNVIAIGNGQFASRSPSTATIDISHSLVSDADATALNVPAGIAIIGSGMLYGATAVATFTNAAGGDFSLVTGSPAIDAGSNAALPAGITTDYAGNDRIQRGTVDIGAFESPFSSDLIVFLDAANSTSYSGSGTTWTDLSTEGNDGTLINSPTFNSTAPESFTFNGTNQYVSVTGGAALSTAAYTKIAWIKVNNLSSTNNIISGSPTIGNHAFWLGGGTTLKAGHNGSWAQVDGSTNLAVGEWYFVAVTFNSTDGWKLYVNGVEEDSDPSTITFNVTTPGTMFLASYDANNFFNGEIALAKVYNDALPASAILNEYNATASRFESLFTWTGGSSNSDVNDTGNWSTPVVPSSGSNFLIPTGLTNYPVLTSNFESGDLEIESDATFTMAPGTTLTFAAGKGATGAGKIILKSDATGDASIGNLTGAGAVGVEVVQERFVAGNNRAFRFLSHPFSDPLPLSVIGSIVDITGVGGAANGFTTTNTNAPSAFRFDPTLADDNGVEDAGWIAFTSTSQTIAPVEGIRMLIRGSKGQSGIFDDGAYTPADVTMAWEGTIHTGDVAKLLSSATIGGEISDWNLVGNPYPSSINMRNITNAGASNFISVWTPRAGDAGGELIPGAGRGGAYVTRLLTDAGFDPIVLPSGSAFFIQADPTDTGTPGTITFTESMKISGESPFVTVLRTEEYASKYGPNSIGISLTRGEQFYDQVVVYFQEAGAEYNKLTDGIKLANPVVNFFTVSADNFALSNDSRAYDETEGTNAIPLHIQSPATTFTLSLPDFDVQEGRTLRLYDRFTKEYITLQKGTTYDFDVTADPATKGHRFDIVMGIDVITSIHPSNNRFQAFLLPNPAQEQVRISIQKPDQVAETSVRIVSMTGSEVRREKLTAETSELDINLSQLSKGLYLVEITHGTERIVKRLIVN